MRPLFDFDGGSLTMRGRTVELQPREADVLQTLIEGRGRCVSTARIIARVWGANEPEAAERVVYVYVAKLRRKLACLGLGIVTRYARGFALSGSVRSLPPVRVGTGAAKRVPRWSEFP